ncbi:hypothetical protein [Bacillus cereus]|uniref:Phage protein n=1 Tax=Bacillus cereus TIAC219 TaxID=718222 RepID=A0ABC9SPH2_BACCE|nr:hypothetical protein [Bacillus cereus]EJP81264.1 hypothetical protein IC1_06510 [Bacillus cereus VD022]EOQ56171.1 hypothetical protein IAY_06564 [Bacillus cereus TIAC219]
MKYSEKTFRQGRKKKQQNRKTERLTSHDIKYLMGAYNKRCNGKMVHVIK